MIVPPIVIKPRPPYSFGVYTTVEGPMLRRFSLRTSLDMLIIFRSGSLGYFISYRQGRAGRKYPSKELLPESALTIRWNVEQTRGNVTFPLSWNEYWFHQRAFGQVDNRKISTYAHLQGQLLEKEVEDEYDF